MTLHDALILWLSATGNNNRPASAVSGRKTAITLAAAALGGPPEEIKLDQLDAFDDTALKELLCAGAKTLGRKAPKGKTLANYTSYLRGVLASSSDGRKAVSSISRRIRRFVRHRPSNGGFEDLPPGIREVIESIILWKSQTTLPDRDERYRRGTWGPATVEQNRGIATRYAHRLLRLLDVEDLTLYEFVSRDNFTFWRQSEEALEVPVPVGGKRVMLGYAAAAQLAILLATVSRQYMKAKAPEWLALEAADADGEPLADFYRRKANQLKDLHARDPSSHTKLDVSHLTPRDFWNVGIREFYAANKIKSGRRSQIHARRRTALAYVIGSVTPFRMRNFREMSWGRHLRRNPNGLWEVHFRGSELKVASRKGVVNVYHHVYGAAVSAVIDDYLAGLKATYGQDIQQRTPFVFTPDPEGPVEWLSTPINPTTFATAFAGLWWNVRGEEITPHRIRDVVATYLIEWGIANGKDGFALAAHALGDTIETILQAYYRPSVDAFAAYEAGLTAQEGDEEI